MRVKSSLLPVLAGLVLGLAFTRPVAAFETGSPVSFTVDPATIRQRADMKTAKVEGIVTLQGPSPDFFILTIRSHDADQISFPSIIFRKGDLRGTSEGVVHWKAVRREVRVRLSAYNADAPDTQLTFTVTLKPLPAPETDDSQPGN